MGSLESDLMKARYDLLNFHLHKTLTPSLSLSLSLSLMHALTLTLAHTHTHTHSVRGGMGLGVSSGRETRQCVGDSFIFSHLKMNLPPQKKKPKTRNCFFSSEAAFQDISFFFSFFEYLRRRRKRWSSEQTKTLALLQLRPMLGFSRVNWKKIRFSFSFIWWSKSSLAWRAGKSLKLLGFG